MICSTSNPSSEHNEPPLQLSEDLVPINTQPKSQIVTVDFNGLLDPPLVLQTEEKEVGGKLWPGGLVLAEYLLRNKKHELIGRTITELGAGSGLVSLALAVGMNIFDTGQIFHITDGSEPLVQLMQTNLDLNIRNISAKTLVVPCLWPWGDPYPQEVTQAPDIILVADCAYLESSFPLLQKSMEDMMTSDGVICYFCYKKRRRADRNMIRRLSRLFSVEKIEGNWAKDGVFLYEIRKGAGNAKLDVENREADKAQINT